MGVHVGERVETSLEFLIAAILASIYLFECFKKRADRLIWNSKYEFFGDTMRFN